MNFEKVIIGYAKTINFIVYENIEQSLEKILILRSSFIFALYGFISMLCLFYSNYVSHLITFLNYIGIFFWLYFIFIAFFIASLIRPKRDIKIILSILSIILIIMYFLFDFENTLYFFFLFFFFIGIVLHRILFVQFEERIDNLVNDYRTISSLKQGSSRYNTIINRIQKNQLPEIIKSNFNKSRYANKIREKLSHKFKLHTIELMTNIIMIIIIFLFLIFTIISNFYIVYLITDYIVTYLPKLKVELLGVTSEDFLIIINFFKPLFSSPIAKLTLSLLYLFFILLFFPFVELRLRNAKPDIRKQSILQKIYLSSSIIVLNFTIFTLPTLLAIFFCKLLTHDTYRKYNAKIVKGRLFTNRLAKMGFYSRNEFRGVQYPNWLVNLFGYTSKEVKYYLNHRKKILIIVNGDYFHILHIGTNKNYSDAMVEDIIKKLNKQKCVNSKW